MNTAKLIYDTSERSADLYYITKFSVPDPVIYLEFRGKRYLMLSDLELDRAKKDAQVDYFLSLTEYAHKAKRKVKRPKTAEIIHELLKEKGIKKLIVPQDTAFDLVDGLRQKRYKVEAGPEPFYAGRISKTIQEVKYIEEAQRTIFAAMRLVKDTLRRSKIKNNRLVYRGRILTSEKLRQMIHAFLVERSYVASHTIVACGPHTVDPHNSGSGPLMPYQPIIVDIFPRSEKNMYFGDATRTFCKGRAPDALKKMYNVVKRGQKMAVSQVKAGINGRLIHEAVAQYFNKQGYPTEVKGGRRQGFFHGTGHGLGLEVHEPPGRINSRDYILKKGQVFSVEPGLYYTGIGGVRLEDLVYVQKNGCRVLGSYPMTLEV